MNCDDALTVLDAYAADALSGPPRAAVDAHLLDCGACRAELGRIRALTCLLRSAQVPAPTPDFAARMVRGAVARVQRRRHWQFTGLAAAATLLIGLALGLIMRPLPWAPDYSEEATLTAGALNTVALHVTATRSIGDVRFELAIPDGFELAGHEGKRHVAWSGRLKPGNNRLKLRLTGDQGSVGVLVASVRYDDQHEDIRLLLRASPEASAGLIAARRPQAQRAPWAYVSDYLLVARRVLRSLA